MLQGKAPAALVNSGTNLSLFLSSSAESWEGGSGKQSVSAFQVAGLEGSPLTHAAPWCMSVARTPCPPDSVHPGDSLLCQMSKTPASAWLGTVPSCPSSVSFSRVLAFLYACQRSRGEDTESLLSRALSPYTISGRSGGAQCVLQEKGGTTEISFVFPPLFPPGGQTLDLEHASQVLYHRAHRFSQFSRTVSGLCTFNTCPSRR